MAMIHSRTPLRVSFVGGGTDLPMFYRKYGGAVVSSAVVHYVDVMVKSLPATATYRYQINGDGIKESAGVDEIEHEITREAIRFVAIDRPLAISACSSLPAGTGLGSSSSYTVGLLNALHALKNGCVSPRQLADEACHIEIEVLKQPIGRQDQYIASSGGLRHTVFHTNETVDSTPANCAPGVRKNLEKCLLLFYLGGHRNAKTILAQVNRDLEEKKNHLQEMKSLCANFLEVLARGTRLHELGEILDVSWHLKRKLNHAISNERIDDIYRRSRATGAIGGKLLGAGGTGVLLLFVDPGQQERVRLELKDFRELQFKCDMTGSRIVTHR